MKTLRSCLKGGPLLILSFALWASGAGASAQTTGATNVPPMVQIASPTNGTIFFGRIVCPPCLTNNPPCALPCYFLGPDITICANASDPDDEVATVEFFANGQGFGIRTNCLACANPINPFCVVWSNVPPGNYVLTAEATDTRGATNISAPVLITVQEAPSNQPPVVVISSPTNGETFTAPADIDILAPAYDPDGPDGFVKTVAFFANYQLLGVYTNPPPPPPGSEIPIVAPHFLWTNVLPGNYKLTAVATDFGGLNATSAPVSISVPPGPPVAYIYRPTNGATFFAPVNIPIYATASASNGLASVEFFADGHDLGPGVLDGCTTPDPIPICIYSLVWSNAPIGNHILTAIPTDNGGLSTTSAPVNIAVLQVPPTNLPPLVSIFVPTNGAVFFVSTNVETSIQLLAEASDPDGSVSNIEFFAGTNDLGPGSPMTLDAPGVNGVTGLVYFIYWRNPSPDNYALTAVATDDGGASTTSAAVNVTIQPGPPPATNLPPVVRIVSPADGSVFRAPINLPLFAYFAHVPSEYGSVGFYDGTNFLGVAHPVPMPSTALSTNIYELVWTNAPVGNHVLTAEAVVGNLLNSLILRIVSTPVSITILPPLPPPTNRPPIVSIVATDPVAIEGTNSWIWSGETNSSPTWAAWPTAVCRFFTNCAPKTATFTVRRCGATNNSLTVTYDIGGTASNGVDYVTLPGFATVPAGQRRALITIVPIDDGSADVNKTVILALTASTNTPPDYLLGFPRRAGAIIIDGNGPCPVTGMLPGHYFHLKETGPNAAWFCIQYSTNMVNWTPVCTNQVIDGSIDFVDPNATGHSSRFYRVVPLVNASAE